MRGFLCGDSQLPSSVISRIDVLLESPGPRDCYGALADFSAKLAGSRAAPVTQSRISENTSYTPSRLNQPESRCEVRS